MTKYSDDNIVDSKATFLCFAASTMMRPKDIHGNEKIAPMASMSALANALYESDPKLATVLAGQYQRAKLIHIQTKLLPFIYIQMEDGQLVSPFTVRRHTKDSIDNRMTMLSAQAIFRRILAEAFSGKVNTYAIERPIDADQTYDKIMAMMPDNVTIHKEARDD